ncbi:MAG: glycosyltransferase, partial [Patescibacteria group bacterium]|nr:glycosyltransferase [Patescibacteria group bacterium]
TGEFVGFLDHDDELYSNALFEVVKRLNKQSDLDIIYSDEDKTNSSGERYDPFFKPDWSPALLLNINYLGHFLVIRKGLLQNYPLRNEFNGAQDYDLVLKASEATNNIAHIAKPLYSWRQSKKSTSLDVNAKKYSQIAAKKCLEEALKRRQIKGEVTEGIVEGSFKVKYHLSNEPKVSIIIPIKDKVHLLKKCLESIKKTVYKNYEIIVVDNRSEEKETLQYLRSIKHKVLKYDNEFNFSKINNFAVKEAKGEYLLFLNNDIEIIEPEWLGEMLSQFTNNEVGVVGSALFYENETIQHGGVMVGFEGKAGNCFIGLLPNQNGYFGLHNMVRNCSAVTAACMLVKKSIFTMVGGFDENIAVAYSDVDFCLKILEKGYQIIYTPYAKLYHYESASRGTLSPREDGKKFNHKWNSFMRKGDPYYNPNLSLLHIYQIKVNENYKPGTLWEELRFPNKSDPYEVLIANEMIECKKLSYKTELEHFAYKPKISIVLPVFNTDSIWLSAAIESVINQIYQNWELCIV